MVGIRRVVMSVLLVMLCSFSCNTAEAINIGNGSKLHIRLHIWNESPENLYLKNISLNADNSLAMQVLQSRYLNTQEPFIKTGQQTIIEYNTIGNITGGLELETEISWRRFGVRLTGLSDRQNYGQEWQLVNGNFERWDTVGQIVDTNELTAVNTEERQLYGANDYLLLLMRTGIQQESFGMNGDDKVSEILLVIMSKTAQLSNASRFE